MTSLSRAGGGNDSGRDSGADSDFPGRGGPSATTEADPRAVGRVRTSYAPEQDGDPDPGEIVWTWVPFEENDGRGKDRPVLVVAREEGGTLLAVQLSSKRHDGDREWVAIGVGPWDREGRESWVDVDRVLRLHEQGMRREACALDRGRFNLVVNRLKELYGWK
ncbi:type II toxin-antitoxin system PemK/MazF family toxin [Streptomyces sp. NPDC087850]|uniref:type II toxin-antitoxin system PemK/MazF family toxin n=1 Tax=Streptomyces sp. NPDC087850 TaxID=3365809 RepID=UPI00381EB77C